MKEDPINILQAVLDQARFAKKIRAQLSRVRAHGESNLETFERIIAQSKKITCEWCRGNPQMSYGLCEKCNGTGEKPYDPFDKMVKEVIER